MEKISAVCAMGWSIELEKGLRSRKPGQPIESINLIGPRLKQWCKEPLPTLSVCNMYGLVPGEDSLFADAILLRLADAFVSGDKGMKISVIRVFLSIRRHCQRKDGQAHGIFVNVGEENRLELLSRVKVALASESIESRALALILLGCFAEIAENVAEIRYAIFSSLFSCHVLEAKASLYAAGCFSEISDDFGSVFLESLLKLMNSSNTLPALRIAGARTFSKMGCSVLLAVKSYKLSKWGFLAGAELVRKTLEEDILAILLISLTKLSLKASVLISEQVGLLNTFLPQKTSLRLQATVLRCIRNVGEEAAAFIPISVYPFQNLFRMLDEPYLSSALRCEVLYIFIKMLAYGLPDMLSTDLDEFVNLLRYVEDATRSPIYSVRLLAFQILVSVCGKLKGRYESMLEVNSVTFSARVVSAISDQITLLVRLVPGGTSSTEVKQELGSLLKQLLLLAEYHSELGSLILDKLHIVIKNVANSQKMPSSAGQDSQVHKVVDTGVKHDFSMHLLMFYIYRFLVVFLEMLDDFGAVTYELVCKSKQLVSFVIDSNLFDCSTHTFFTLLLHSLVNWSSSIRDLSGSHSKLIESEIPVHVCSKNMVIGGDNWCAYKAGKYAACEGEWYVASFIFQHLETKVQSDIFCRWFKFLVQFTQSEKNVKVLLQKGTCCLPLTHDLGPTALNYSPRVNIPIEYIDKLFDAFNDASSSDKILEAISLQTQTFCFQRWFIALRLKVLLILVDILKLLKGCLDYEAGLENNEHTGGIEGTDKEPTFRKMKDFMSSLVEVSVRLACVAEEYDLISSSFVDLDSKSLKVISSLALSCSVLAFCTGFTNLIPSLPIFADLLKEPGYCQIVIMKDLVVRLWHADSRICKDLLSFLKEHQVHERSLHFFPGFGLRKVCHISEDILTLCRFSVGQLTGLQNEYICVLNEDTMWRVYKDRMRLLLDIVEAWMHIPFRVPKYFFRVRRTVGSLLISLNADDRKQNEICVLRGSQLALNLCVQLKNVTSDVCSRFSKIYCILSCKTSFLGTRCDGQIRGEGWIDYQALETDILKDLNKKLQFHVMNRTREFMNCGDPQSDGETIETCVCFITNGATQGFSTCLLDVSAFPVGFYRIYWHCGGVDCQGVYWSFLPLSPCPQFSVLESYSERR